MRDVHILQELLAKQCPEIHQKRLTSLMVATSALLEGDTLSLTALGRSINGAASAKHSIKRIDRLLGNPHLHSERLALYRWHASNLCGLNPMPVILIDWSDVREQLRHMTLRASIVLKGRSITLYERAFAWEDYNSPRSHNRFLRELASILPSGATPLLITDAGYRNTWFREVASYGWYWLGRVRGNVAFTSASRKQWCSNKTLYPNANHKPRYIGLVDLARKSPIRCHLYLYKSSAKGRKDRRTASSGSKHTAQREYLKGSKEPWLLATNLPTDLFSAAQVVRFYAKRMQIEESFRDLKSPLYGFGLRHSRTRCPRRYDILLLIALLAEIILWWFGLAAQQAGWQRHFQANTIRHRAVLSSVRLGKEIRRRPKYPITEQMLYWARLELMRLAHSAGISEL
ncbi:IS4 family transposase [uncultured Oceanisphaera sp.]|uniref:IS4 family transposase n=1 Tax=uncultured Oceanisphaera sp. TaxID=353858 RepID=UPI0026044D6A|nr:IS4 family transposase [uncultured Oceanisphaera sp.]